MKAPRRSSPSDLDRDSEVQKWWETDELTTLVDAVAITGLDEESLDSLVRTGAIAAIEHNGIRFFRHRDLWDFAVPK